MPLGPLWLPRSDSGNFFYSGLVVVLILFTIFMLFALLSLNQRA